MTIDWFRSWHGAPTDSKWIVIARRANVAPGMVSAVAWALLDYASQKTDRGSVAGFDAETYAAYAGWEEADMQRILDALRDKGVITPDDRLAAWDKRQPKREDYSTERVRNHRKRTAESETQCNAMEHNGTNGNGRLREDTDTDKDKNNTNGASAGADAPVLDPFATCLQYLDEPKANKPAAVAKLYKLRFGEMYPPRYDRLGHMAKELSGDFKALARIIWSASVPEGDPHDYLQGIIAKSKARRNQSEVAAEVY